VGSEVQILPGPPIPWPPIRWLPQYGSHRGGGVCARLDGADDPAPPSRPGAKVGGVAQLGEHLLCKQGVTGSIPVVSTRLVKRQWPLRRRFGLAGGAAAWLLGLYRGMSRIRFDHGPGQSVPGCVVVPFVLPGWVVLFFVSVNQVLVRLWARVIGTGKAGFAGVRAVV
jgi:hypothetical protein